MNSNRDRIRETSMEVTVGFFLFMLLLALGVFTILLSREGIRPTTAMEVRFSEVLGLREGDNISVRGVNAGKIRRIEMEDFDVRIVMALNRELKLREDYRIEILNTSVLGGRYLNIYEGSPASPLLAPDTPLVGTTPADLVDEATRTVQAVRKTLVEDGLLKDLQGAAENLNKVTERLERGEGTLGKLMADDEMYEDLSAITADLREVTGRLERGEGTLGRLLVEDDVYNDLRAISGKLARGESTIGKFLMDDGKVYEDIGQIAENLKTATDNIAAGRGLLGRLLSDDDTMYDDLKATAANLRELTDALERGEGTLGKLMRDESLYAEVRMLINEIRATVDDFRETTPITTFVSIFMGAF
jgi:phospholipid/cholesterol/gamma-HCH transport system substrate-binding protein